MKSYNVTWKKKNTAENVWDVDPVLNPNSTQRSYYMWKTKLAFWVLKWKAKLKLPGVIFRGRAKSDRVIRRRSACKSAGLVIVRVAVGAWASVLENLRIRRRLASVGRPKRAFAAILRGPERLARALTCHALFSIHARNPKLRRTRAVEVSNAPRAGAVIAGPTLGSHQHRHVVTVHEAHVEEIEASVGVEGELGQGRRWRSAVARTFELAGATIAGHAGEFSGGVLRAESAAP